MARVHAPSWLGPGLAVLFVVPLLVYGAYSIGDRWYQNFLLTQQEEAIRAEVTRLREENLRLQRDLVIARSDAGIEKRAREQLGLVRPGDTAIQIVGPGGPPRRRPGRLDPPRPRPQPSRNPRQNAPAGSASSMASSDADVVSTIRCQVADVLDRQEALQCRCPIVVAVSGGADSLCLLDAAVAAIPEAQQRVRVAHVDHMLRPNSSADAEYVKRVALSLGVSGTVDTVNVLELAKAEHIGVEEAARIGRYRILRRYAHSVNAHFLLTGHTRDDLVETTVLHLIRGTGLRGLAGINEIEHLAGWTFLYDPVDTVTDLRLVRPLLQVGRADTLAYCEARDISYLTDESNADPTFARNRIRGHLLPVLRTYNPSIDQALARMARILGDEDAWLDEVAIERWADLRVDSGVDNVLRLVDWNQQPLPIQRRIVRLMAGTLGHEEIGFEAVERALAVGAEDGPPRAELGGGVTVERRQDTLFFTRSQRQPHD